MSRVFGAVTLCLTWTFMTAAHSPFISPTDKTFASLVILYPDLLDQQRNHFPGVSVVFALPDSYPPFHHCVLGSLPVLMDLGSSGSQSWGEDHPLWVRNSTGSPLGSDEKQIWTSFMSAKAPHKKAGITMATHDSVDSEPTGFFIKKQIFI